MTVHDQLGFNVLPLSIADICDNLFARLSVGVWIYDIDRARVLWANAIGLEIWAAESLEALRSRDLSRDMSPAVARRLRQYQEDFRSKDAVFCELWTLYPGGVPKPLNVRFSGITLADGRTAMLCEALGTVHQTPETLRGVDALIHTQLIISLYSRRGENLYHNPAARNAYRDDADGLASHFRHRADYDALIDELDLKGEVSRILEVRTVRGLRWHELTVRACHDPASGAPAILISEVDVSELKEAEERANHIAFHDALTALPNRSSITRTFARLIPAADRYDERFGVVFIDLDEFKFINDSLGHAAGDQVLIEVARRLSSVCGPYDHLVRLGGDEFLALMPFSDQQALTDKVKAILATLSQPIAIGSHKLLATPSIGVSIYPEAGADREALMQAADLAMYEAKASGKRCVRFFTPAMREKINSRLEMADEIRCGIASGQFEVYYQPRVRGTDLQVIGAEALVRWNHPRHGLMQPGQFIPLCEETGLIEELGGLVMRSAMAQQSRWAKAGFPIAVSINVSQRQLTAGDFDRVVAACLAESGCDPAMIELELTETLLLQRPEETADLVSKIRGRGVRIAIDDFGTGYSNLARLHETTIDCVKIDRSFVKDLPGKAAVALIIIALCRMLEVEIVAEGVETLEQLAWLQAHGCHQIQGYFVSRPIPADEFTRLFCRPVPRSPVITPVWIGARSL